MSEPEKPFICYVTAMVAQAGNIHWNIDARLIWEPDDEEGLVIAFPAFSELKLRSSLRLAKEAVEKNNLNWIAISENDISIDLEGLFAFFPDLPHQSWLRGRVSPRVEIVTEDIEVFNETRKESTLQLIVTQQEVHDSMPKRIFLSHKGVNKPTVRSYANALRTVGFDPWLDEDAMVAGVPLERALYQGMKESCAAVFFVTPDYKDENYLSTEVNYALEQKREKGDRFSLISLVLSDPSGRLGTVPDVLRQFVWKQPTSELEAMNEILRALPIRMERVAWKA